MKSWWGCKYSKHDKASTNQPFVTLSSHEALPRGSRVAVIVNKTHVMLFRKKTWPILNHVLYIEALETSLAVHCWGSRARFWWEVYGFQSDNELIWRDASWKMLMTCILTVPCVYFTQQQEKPTAIGSSEGESTSVQCWWVSGELFFF
jgi:hypothetical protein